MNNLCGSRGVVGMHTESARRACPKLAIRKEPMKLKYRNKPTTVSGRRFASKREAAAYVKLAALEKAGAISGLECQYPFKLEVNGQLICKYVADFVFFRNGQFEVADAKGFRTKEYGLKRKLMRAIHGVEIVEL